MPDELDGFTRSTFTAGGRTKDVYRTGSGPAILVISEMPGITPEVAAFARKAAGIGCTAVMPHLFGTPGRPATVGYTLDSLARVCISHEILGHGPRANQPGHRSGCAPWPATSTTGAVVREWAWSACA